MVWNPFSLSFLKHARSPDTEFSNVVKISNLMLVLFIFFMYLGFASLDICDSQDSRERGIPILIPLYHFQPFYNHLDSWAITAKKLISARSQ